jgi:hypothetical protein
MSSFCQFADYFCNSCIDEENGRISAVAFTKRGVPIVDWSDPQNWKDVICNGLGRIIPEVRGTYDGSAPVTNTGYGRVQTRKTSANHTVNYMHIWQAENVDFYNNLSRSTEYDFFFATETKLWRANAPVYISPTSPIAENVDSLIEFNVTVIWTKFELPEVYDLPPGLFTSCEQLEETLACYNCQPLSISPCP